MSNETEKLTINLGVVDLAQVDVLVEQGLYSNRSDLIRSAIRKELEAHQKNIEEALRASAIIGYVGTNPTGIFSVGICCVSKADLEEAYQELDGQKFKISVIGMLKLDSKISAELFAKTVSRVTVRGKLVATPEIKKLIEEMK
ncbi:MAG: hypothetical protein FWE19_05735 [Oscillospiraceae bacterium]|nr:hypothetical protein [Oscillospiraceae bacterium]